MCLLIICMFSLERCSNLLPIFKLGSLFSYFEFWQFIMYSGYKSVIGYVLCRYLLPVFCLFFHPFNSIFGRAKAFNINKVQLTSFFLFWISRCKLIYIEWINSGVLPYSTGNYIQYPVIKHNGKEYEKEYIYMYNWVTLLYSRNEHIINQLYFNKIFKKYISLSCKFWIVHLIFSSSLSSPS